MSLLDHDRTVLVLVDLQDRLVRGMPASQRQPATDQAIRLRTTAARLEIPVLFTEIEPRSFGRVVPGLAAAHAVRHDRFGLQRCEAFMQALDATGREIVVLAGLETHVAILQTAVALHQQGRQVEVVADACLSRSPLDHDLSLRRLTQEGVGVLPADAILFSWVDDARSPLFQELVRSWR